MQGNIKENYQTQKTDNHPEDIGSLVKASILASKPGNISSEILIKKKKTSMIQT